MLARPTVAERRFDNRRVVVVTGAGRGIGRATAEVFGGAGFIVVVAERLRGLGAATARVIASRGQSAIFIHTDVADTRSSHRLVREVRERYGRIDCLVNNAGILRVGDFHDLSLRDLDRVLAVNLRGPMVLTRAVLPLMREQGEGVIINVASQLGKTGLGGYVAYCASKFGVVGFSDALGSESEGTGVRVWAVCPGLTDTPLARLTGVSARERHRLIPPERVARTILDLATGRRRVQRVTVDVL